MLRTSRRTTSPHKGHLMNEWKKAAVRALLHDLPFCWIHNQREASIAGMELEAA